MIDKLAIIEERISNIQFHIDHVNTVMENPGLYETPSNKTPENLEQYLLDLTSKKQALENEKQALTNQSQMI
jgi:hypothetical protein